MKAQIELYIQEHSQLVKVQAFLTANPNISYRMSYTFNNSHSEAFNYIPNHEFISLCGSENLSRDGCISEKGAYDVLINYAKQNNLFYNSHIELNDYLRSVLKCADLSITIDSIPATFKRLFRVKEELSAGS
jgi:hypothetical protein